MRQRIIRKGYEAWIIVQHIPVATFWLLVRGTKYMLDWIQLAKVRVKEAMDTYMRDLFVCTLSRPGCDSRLASGYGASSYRDGHWVGATSRMQSTCIRRSTGCAREVSR